jgi:hypothetical protein
MAPCPFDHGADAPGLEGLTALVAVSGIFQSGAECSVAQAAGAPLGKKRRSAKRCDVGSIGRRYRHPGLLKLGCGDVYGVRYHCRDLGGNRARSHVADQLSRDDSLLVGLMAIHSA